MAVGDLELQKTSSNSMAMGPPSPPSSSSPSNKDHNPNTHFILQYTLTIYNAMDKYTKFTFLVIGIMFFFGCHNYMQELIMNLPGFKVGVFLGYLEVLGVTICSFFERKLYGETTRKASWSSYLMLTFCLLISSATSNIALAYINYPTKVVFRSCKLIPTMLIAVLYLNKRVAWYEFVFGILISLGMVLFAAADFHVYPNFDFVGKQAFCLSSNLEYNS